MFALMLSPATKSAQVSFKIVSFTETPTKSMIEAAETGAMTGLKIAGGVATVVMAFVAIVALINGIIGGDFQPGHCPCRSGFNNAFWRCFGEREVIKGNLRRFRSRA